MPSDTLLCNQLAQDVVRAWNERDATALAGLFAADAVMVTWFGDRMDGRPAIQEAFRRLLSTAMRQTTIASLAAEERALGPDVVVIYWAWALSSRGMPTQAGQWLFVAHRAADAWQIVSAQNTLTLPRPSPE